MRSREIFHRTCTNGYTIGILGYSGKNVLDEVADFAVVGTGPNVDITRYALSADLNLQRFNLFGMYMLMKDSYDEELMFSAMEGSKERKFSGWFVEADYLLQPGLAAVLRWDSLSDEDNSKNQTQATANLSYFLAENMKLLFEYAQLETDADFNFSVETTQKKYLARASYAF